MTPKKTLEKFIKTTGYTQQEVADCLGFSREYINRILNGAEVKNPDFFVSAVQFKTQNFGVEKCQK